MRVMRDHAVAIIAGRRYRWTGWFGCQLESMEWRRVPAGTEREILGRKFRVWRTEREWLRVRTLWCLIGLGRSVDEDSAKINALRDDLRALL